jgi:hypothetical protein
MSERETEALIEIGRQTSDAEVEMFDAGNVCVCQTPRAEMDRNP